MSKNRKNSLILFAVVVVVIGILLPARRFDSGGRRAASEDVSETAGGGQDRSETVKLVVAPVAAPVVRETREVQKTESAYAVAVTPQRETAVGESSRDAYPESTLFAKEESPKKTRPARPAYYADEDFGDDPLLPSRPAVPTRHISEKKLVVDSEEALLIPGQHLANGRHLTRRFTHVIEDDDSLESIAKRYLWDESRAKDIFEENRGVLPSMTELPIGETIIIPERE